MTPETLDKAIKLQEKIDALKSGKKLIIEEISKFIKKAVVWTERFDGSNNQKPPLVIFTDTDKDQLESKALVTIETEIKRTQQELESL